MRPCREVAGPGPFIAQSVRGLLSNAGWSGLSADLEPVLEFALSHRELFFETKVHFIVSPAWIPSQFLVSTTTDLGVVDLIGGKLKR